MGEGLKHLTCRLLHIEEPARWVSPVGDIVSSRRRVDLSAVLTKDNPGEPLSCTARHAGTRHVAAFNETTSFNERVAAVGQDINGAAFWVWDGPGGGAFSTNILVADGDLLSINAAGTNWSGVFATGDYGPDGWTTWDRPSGSGYPLPNNRPFALAGAWDGAQVDPNAGNGWFYIGSGINAIVGHGARGPARVLYLGLNDNNPLNGDANKKFTVLVNVRRRPLRNVGPAII